MKGDLSVLKYIKNLKGKWAVLALAVVGVMLLLLGSGAPSGQSRETRDGYTDTSEKFKSEVILQIKEICTRVSGDENPTVTLTLERGEEYVYARRSDGSYVTSSGDAVLLCARAPLVRGVAVVCRNGDDPELKGAITSLVCALLGIGSNKVFVSSAK